MEDVPADALEVRFSVLLQHKRKQTGAVDWAGPFVHGKVGERFLYLCWGERHGVIWHGVRRAKFPLRYLDQQRISAAITSGKSLEVSLRMTDHRGPICATIPEAIVEWVTP